MYIHINPTHREQLQHTAPRTHPPTPYTYIHIYIRIRKYTHMHIYIYMHTQRTENKCSILRHKRIRRLHQIHKPTEICKRVLAPFRQHRRTNISVCK